MEQEQTNPPEVTPATDGTPDVELLRAISANAECAHILAAIAAGGNPKELLATLLPAEGKPNCKGAGGGNVSEPVAGCGN